MAEEIVQTGGAEGAPATPEASSSQSDADLLASLDKVQETPEPSPADQEFLKKLESLDPGALPEQLRRKLESPFLSQYGKKTSEIDAERKALLSVIEKLTAGNGQQPQPTADQRKQLLEEIANGNTQAIEGLVENLVNERTGPQMDYISRTRAVQEAAELMPELPKYEAQVAQQLQQDPDLLRLASIDNRRYASKILAGLAWRQHAQALEAEKKALVAEGDLKAKKAVEAYKRQLAGLPTSTSRAGTTPTGAPAEAPKGLRDALEEAWAEAGGS